MASNGKISPALIKISEASEVLKVHPNTLRRWDKMGLLKPIRFGERKDRHYRISDIERLFKKPQELIKNQIDTAEIEERIVKSEINSNLLEQINAAATKFLIPLDPEETYAIIIEEAKKIVGAEFGSVFLLENKNLVRTYASSSILHKIAPRKYGRTYSSLKEKRASTYTVKSIKEPHPMLKKLGIKLVIYIPLISDVQSTGVLNLLSTRNKIYTPKELELFNLFGTLASLAIVKTQLYAETKNSLDNQRLYHSLASHEIKTPLTSIFAYAQLIEKKLKKKENLSIEIVEKIGQETLRTIRMIDSFLGKNNDTTNIYNAHKRCDLKDILDRALSDFRALYPNNPVFFNDKVKSTKAIVSGDFDKLLQAIINLLNNAVKYSESGSKIFITLSDSNKDYSLKIRDNGIGIEKNELKHVFDKFYRINSTKKGMGLGLYLVKMIIDEHRGKIIVNSILGKGSTFTILLAKK